MVEFFLRWNGRRVHSFPLRSDRAQKRREGSQVVIRRGIRFSAPKWVQQFDVVVNGAEIVLVDNRYIGGLKQVQQECHRNIALLRIDLSVELVKRRRG